MTQRDRGVRQAAPVEVSRARASAVVGVGERHRHVRRRWCEAGGSLQRAGAGEAVRVRGRAEDLLAVGGVRPTLRRYQRVARGVGALVGAEQRRHLRMRGRVDHTGRVAGDQVVGGERELDRALWRVDPVPAAHRQLAGTLAPDLVDRERRRRRQRCLEVERGTTPGRIEGAKVK